MGGSNLPPAPFAAFAWARGKSACRDSVGGGDIACGRVRPLTEGGGASEECLSTGKRVASHINYSYNGQDKARRAKK